MTVILLSLKFETCMNIWSDFIKLYFLTKNKLQAKDNFSIYWFNDSVKSQRQTLNPVIMHRFNPSSVPKALVKQFKTVYRKNFWSTKKAIYNKFINDSIKKQKPVQIDNKYNIPIINNRLSTNLTVTEFIEFFKTIANELV